MLETHVHIGGAAKTSFAPYWQNVPCLGPASLKCHSHAHAALGLVEDAAVPQGQYLLQVSMQERGVPPPSALQWCPRHPVRAYVTESTVYMEGHCVIN